MYRVNTQCRCKEVMKSHFNRIISYCLSLAGKHCLQLKCCTAEMQHSRMQKQCLRSVPGSSKFGLMHVASLQKQMANSLHMCNSMLYMNTTQGYNKRAMDYHLCEHVTASLRSCHAHLRVTTTCHVMSARAHHSSTVCPMACMRLSSVCAVVCVTSDLQHNYQVSATVCSPEPIVPGDNHAS